NPQKVLLCRWLATQPEVLILDEPTRGIDIGAKTEIMAQVIPLPEDGVATEVISSEIAEVVRPSDRIMETTERTKLAQLVVDETATSYSIITSIADESAPEQPGSTQTAGTGAGS